MNQRRRAGTLSRNRFNTHSPQSLSPGWRWQYSCQPSGPITASPSTSMGREQALDLLVLLSALESAFMASNATIPDYLLERIGDSVEMLRGEVLT